MTFGASGGLLAVSTTERDVEMAALSIRDMTESLDRAMPCVDEHDRRNLAELSRALTGERELSVGEVAEMLGVSSPTTICNWLDRGYFPGATRTPGGQRRFKLADVLAVKDDIARTRAANESSHIEFHDFGDEDPYAGR